jgi:hypothetical protein
MLRGGEAEAEYGFDVTEFIGSTTIKAAEASLPGRIQAELSKDERIESVDVEVVATLDGTDTSFAITIDAQTGEGPFTLQLSATDVTVELIGVT